MTAANKSPSHAMNLETISVPASAWLVRWSGLLRPAARALDYAAGRGRNTQVLLAAGARVTAVDRDAAALAAIDPAAERIVADLEADPWPFGERRFDVLVCCNYLHRPRLSLMAGLVAPGGLVIMETFAAGNERWGRPSRPDFLLRPGELFAACERAGFVVLGFEHGFTANPRQAMVQRVCAVRPPFDPQHYPLVG